MVIGFKPYMIIKEMYFMQKTKIGIPAGLLAAAVFFVTLFSGYTGLILLAGYILLFEEDKWLKKMAVKAFFINAMFSLFSALIGFIPDVLSLINNIFGIFGKTFYIVPLSGIAVTITAIISIVKKFLFIVLGLKALNRGTVAIGSVDKIADKAIDD